MDKYTMIGKALEATRIDEMASRMEDEVKRAAMTFANIDLLIRFDHGDMQGLGLEPERLDEMREKCAV